MAQKLSISNPNPRQLPGPQLLHELIPRSTEARTPAIEFCAENGETSELSYEELHGRANRLANRLLRSIESSPAPSKCLVFPIFIQQSIPLYVSQLAALKAGGAFCPISLDVPEERLRFILNDVEASVLLTTADRRDGLPQLDQTRVIVVDGDEAGDEDPATVDSSEPTVSVSPQDAAYVMYTSGSTGQPKGVLISHASATQALLAHDRHIPKFSRFLQFASPTFDVSVFEIFFPLFRVRTLVSCDRRRLLNDLPAAIEKLRIDAAELTPSVASNLLRGRKSVPTLRVLLTIGEMLKPGVVEEFGTNPDEPGLLHGMYGPTEATIHCTLHTEFPKDMSCSSIGVPLDTVSAFVIKPPPDQVVSNIEVEVLPLGEEGELAVGGFQLADGYLNRPEQTAAAFVHHPQYGRLYRTGDRARMLPDGRFECLGRISSGQVKLRGQRIELGEIEHAASKTPGCRSAVADVISGILVAFCVGEDSLSTKSIRETCQRWLPSYMVPGDIVILQDLPYLPSGKLDRKSLNKLYAESQTPSEEHDGLSNDRTRAIVDVLENILGCAVRTNSVLPSLGLDSLAAIRVASELKRKGYPQLDAAKVLVARTASEIAAQLDEACSATPTKTDRNEGGSAFIMDEIKRLPVIESCEHEIHHAFHCTPTQSAMLGETYKNPEMYCNWIELQVAASLDSVQSALLRLSDHHYLLRSGFVALSEGEATFATIVWKQLSSSQIRTVSKFDLDFRIDSDQGLLRPCSVQMVNAENGVRLLLHIHHALYDQWSIDVLRADLATLLSGQKPSPSPGFDVVSEYYAHHPSSTDSNDELEFWEGYLRNANLSTFPSLIAKRAAPTLSYTTWRSTTVASSKLKTSSQSLHVSAPSIFQAALSLLLSYYVGSTEVVFGSVFSGRTIAVPDIDRVFGPCLATLPLRVDVKSAHTRHDLLAAITRLNRTVQTHIQTPPAMIKKASGISPGSPMFDVLFVWQQSSVENSHPSLVNEVNCADRHEFNLVLEFDPSMEFVQVKATYRQSLISTQQVDIFIEQLVALTSDILNHPSSSEFDLGRVLPSNLLSIANPQPQSAVSGKDLVSALEVTGGENSDLPAVIFNEGIGVEERSFSSITYRQLHERANKIANALISSGLHPEELVCICMEKSIDLYVCILATIKAGAGYLPLLPETPPARVSSILSQSPTRFCLCDSPSLNNFEGYGGMQVWNVSDLELSKFSGSRPQASQQKSRTAYAVYTSGSTGEPKGVAVSVHNLHANLEVLSDLYATKPGDRLLQACSQAFDVSVFEIFFAFYTGMTLCSAPKESLFRDIEQGINAFKISHLSLTPTVAALVNPENVPTVRFLVTAGEGITQKVFNRWAGKGLHQGYGPSETTNICTVNMDVSSDDAINNIGPPFRNTSAFVIAISEDFSILPAGSFGEFAFGGEQVFRGYIGRDELNAEKIIDHPEYGRVYRSGDTGRILHDGTLLISGRLDDQVKIRGNRVELGEINAVLMRQTDVLDCTTMVIGQGSVDQFIASFLVPGSPQEASKENIIELDKEVMSSLFNALEDVLPAYMVPSFIIPVDRLPRTSQGKLDKRQLHTIWSQLSEDVRNHFSRSHDSDQQEEPFRPKEEAIARKLSEILRVPLANLSRHSSFFAVGLNSLNAIQFAKSLESIAHGRVSIAMVLRNSNIARLAKLLDSEERKQPRSDNVTSASEVFRKEFVQNIEERFRADGLAVESVLPCTPLQEAMLSASGSASSSAYSNMTRLQVHGDVEKLKRSWQELVKRHSILRTRFVETPISSHPYAQVLLKDPTLPWFEDINPGSRTTTADGQQTARQDSHVSASNPFTIGVHYFEGALEITLHMHHAIYDGISMSNLFDEVESTYRDEESEQPVPFEPFLTESLTHNGQESIKFWTERFGGFQPHPLPKLADSASDHDDMISTHLPISTSDLDTFCETNSITALSVFQAAWLKTLACAQSVSDVCFGNVVSGRIGTVQDVDRLIAPCFNTIPVRTNLDHMQSSIDLIRYLHRSNVDNLDHQLTALRRIQALSTDPSAHLFDSLMLLQPPSKPLDSSIWIIREETGSMDLPLVLEIVPQDGRFVLHLHFMGEFVSSAIAQGLKSAFSAALLSCLRFSSSSVDKFVEFDPSTIAGKLAPKNYGANGTKKPAESTSDDSEWSTFETAVRQIFATLAGVDVGRISKETSLYQIGLDSLNAVQVASQLRQQGFHIDAADVMQRRTPADIGNVLVERTGSDEKSVPKVDFQSFDERYRPRVLESTGLDTQTVEAIRPCTPAQKGMLAQSLQTEGRLYVNNLVYAVPNGHDANQIRKAWRDVQRKHRVLRMGFCQLEDGVNPFALVVHKLDSTLASGTTIDGSNTIESFESARTHILQNLHLPVWRLRIVETSEKERTMHLTIHHAIYDAESLQILLSDFGAALDSQDIGPVVELDPTLSSSLEASERGLEESEKFWSKALEAASYAKFPNLCPTVVTGSDIGTIQDSSSIRPATLDAFCKENGVTIQAIGQTVWAMLMATYTGDPGVTFGTVFSGHSSSSSRSAAFPSITTIPVFCDTTQPIIDTIKNMLTFNASAQKHRFTPLTEIQRFSGRAGQNLFDTVFVYQKSSLPHDSRFKWELVSETAAVDYTISLELEYTPRDRYDIRLTFDTKVLPNAHASLMLKQYDYMLRSLVESDPDQSEVPEELISILPPKEYELPSPVTLLHEFVTEGARKYPEKIALEFITSLEAGTKGRKTWTYRDLDEQSNQIAHMLQKFGVQSGGVVALCMPKCAEASLAFAAISKAGCAFLAMDPDLPIARKQFILEDSKSQLLLVADESEWEAESDVRVIPCREKNFSAMPTSPVEISPLHPSATSYCLYTSGTTGTPKGCELTHENAVQAMMSFQRLFSGHWTESSRWLQFASYWFDVSILEQFWSWSIGITVVGAPRDLILEDLAGFLRSAEITHIDLTPSLARLITPGDVPSLCKGVFITGGEALKQEIIDAWGPKNVICNGYGPTEATIGVTMNRFIGTDAKPLNIGKQFDNVGTLVLAPGTETPVLRGGVGELCISGKLVGKGYLNRPDQTNKAFPFLKSIDQKVYRTGDLVRMLADNSFSFIGRQDTQAKLRGQRLEIDEIDAVINSADAGISEVASLVVKASDGNREMLVSYITQSETDRSKLYTTSSTPSKQLVQTADQACKDHLPGYMVPTHIIPISHIPLTVNNKVDSKRLVALFQSLSQQELQGFKQKHGDERKLSTTEQKVVDALQKLLDIKTEDVTPSSNIFSLGLSSISAINFTAVLRRNGFKSANVADVMKNPTIERLAKSITSHDSGTSVEQNAIRQAQLTITAFAQRFRNFAAATLSKDITKIESISPCTPLQEGLLIESMKSDARPYFNQFLYRVESTDLPRVFTAIQNVMSNVQILRTVFIKTDEGFAQVVLQDVEVPIDEHSADDQHLNDFLSERKADWQNSADQDVLLPLEVLIVQTPSKAVLAFHVHHAIYDGISWDQTMNMLNSFYNSGSSGKTGPKFTEALPYGPLCARPDSAQFWRERLQNATFSPLPVLTQTSTEQISVGRTQIQFAEAEETRRRKLGVSHQAIFEASFVAALTQSFPDTETYGLVVSGRSIGLEDADLVIGPMFNTIPCAVVIGSSDTWNDHLKRCHEANVASLPFQHSPLRDIRKSCNRPPTDSMFDVLFVFQRREESTPNSVFQEIDSAVSPDYPLAFEVELLDTGKVNVLAAAQSNVATPQAMQDLIDSFSNAFGHIMRGDGEKVCDQFEIRDRSHVQKSAKPTNGIPGVNGHTDADWTEQALTLRDAISQLAGCDAEEISQETTIFTLGLDSIDAVKLSSRLKKAGHAIPVSKILQSQTIEKMLACIQNDGNTNGDVNATKHLERLEKSLSPTRDQLASQHGMSIERVVPASPGQEALIAEMLRSDFHQYFNHDILRLDSDVDLDRLQLAWQHVIDVTPILRTSFVEITDSHIDAVFAQVIHRPSPVRFDHTRVDSMEALTASLEDIRRDALDSFVSRSPLRLTIATVQSVQYLVLSLSHAQYDGHSLGLIHEDVTRAYHDHLKRRPSNDKILDESLRAADAEALQFWRSSLSGSKLSRLVTLRTASPQDPVHRAERTCSISAKKARAECQRFGVSMQSLAQTVWTVLLTHHSQSLEVVFGAVLACRDSEEAGQVSFPTMNTVPIRASVHGSGIQMLRHIQTTMNDILPYQRTPLRAIQKACANTIHMGGKSDGMGLFDAIFIYQAGVDTAEDQQHLLYKSVEGSSNIEYPLAVELEAVNETLIVRAACRDSVMSQEDTDKLLQQYDRVLGILLDAPDEPVVAFSGNQVSVCGMPKFELPADGPIPQVDGAEDAEAPQGEEDGATSPTASTIKSVLSQVSGVPEDEIAFSASIESIGVDSISAIKVAALLRKQSIRLTVSDMLKASTINKMAQYAHGDETPEASGDDGSSEMVLAELLKALDTDEILAEADVHSDDVEYVLPANAGQEYMINMWQRTEGQIFWPTFQYQLEGDHAIASIRKAWEKTVSRQPMLRAVFCKTQSLQHPLVQLILKRGTDLFYTEDDTDKPDLAIQPMARLFVKRTENGYQLDLKIHHALYDAVSLPLILDDLAAFLTDSEPHAPQVDLKDFLALTLNPSTQSPRQQFWTDHLSDLHLTHPLPQPRTTGAQRKLDIFKPSLVSSIPSLERLARREGVSLQSLFFAAYAQVYAGLTAASAPSSSSPPRVNGDVVLGIYLSNRSHLPGLDRLAAPTLNLLPLAIRDVGKRSTRALAKAIHADLRAVGAKENCGVSLREIEEWTGVKVDSFVNLLRLPDRGERTEEEEEKGLITEVEGESRHDRSRVREAEDFGKGVEVPQGLHRFETGDAYQHSIDIELIVADGVLDLGIFGSVEMLGLEEAEGAIAEFTRLLRELEEAD